MGAATFVAWGTTTEDLHPEVGACLSSRWKEQRALSPVTFLHLLPVPTPTPAPCPICGCEASPRGEGVPHGAHGIGREHLDFCWEHD